MGVEGLVGIQLWLHSPTTPTRTLVQVPGEAYHMRASDFVRHVRDSDSPLNALCAKYAHPFLVMTSQTAACNRLHPVNERLCRWLCLFMTGFGGMNFRCAGNSSRRCWVFTRPTVSTAASMLQQAGLISHSPGRLPVLDPEGLKNGSYECLEIVEKQFGQIFEEFAR